MGQHAYPELAIGVNGKLVAALGYGDSNGSPFGGMYISDILQFTGGDITAIGSHCSGGSAFGIAATKIAVTGGSGMAVGK